MIANFISLSKRKTTFCHSNTLRVIARFARGNLLMNIFDDFYYGDFSKAFRK